MFYDEKREIEPHISTMKIKKKMKLKYLISKWNILTLINAAVSNAILHLKAKLNFHITLWTIWNEVQQHKSSMNKVQTVGYSPLTTLENE